MSTHVITEAILGKAFFGLGMLSRDPTRRLRDDWNNQIEIIAKNSKVGVIPGKAGPPEANNILIARNNREDLRRSRKHLS
jgi:hypothetical protein